MSIHNPSSFNPADYEVEDYLDNRRPAFFRGEDPDEYRRVVAQWQADMARALGPDWRAKAHHCVHCGNGNVRWITAVRHLPTNEVVVFGSDCTHRLGFRDRVAFKLAQLKARAEQREFRAKTFKQREDFVQAHPAIADALEAVKRPEHAKNSFVLDVLAKLNRFGTLSDRQVAAVTESLARDLARAAQALEPKGDAPEGRCEVTGEVVSIKVQDTDFGTQVKMLMKLENNAKVWCTMPAALQCKFNNGEFTKGQRVVIKATFERSPSDRSFSFGKRPTFVKVP